jgi:hypothetical protein
MATTPVFTWPYQALTDPPDGPNLGEDLALAIEATVVSYAGQIAATNAAMPYRARTKLASPAAAITMSSIPSTLRSLRVKWLARGNDASTWNGMHIRVNGSASAVYSSVWAENNVAGLSRGTVTAQTQSLLGLCINAGSAGGLFASGVIDFPGWDSSAASAGLTFLFKSAHDIASGVTYDGFGKYAAAGPYTSLTFFPAAGSFIAGTDIQLIGEVA